MAKNRKTAALSPEERLAQALVPDWEQPYLVPENWCWVYLGAIATVNPPKVPRTVLPQQVSFVPMSAVSENTGAIEAAEIRRASDVASGYTYFQDNDIIFAKITPCMENGKSAIASNLKNGMAFGSTEFYVLRASCCLSKELLYHLLRSKWFRDEARENMSGAVGQQRVKKEFLLSYPFPLPPLAEQQRIVDRIESLFAKLDEAKEEAKAVLDGFEGRRAAILHQAFTGKLTTKWRREHGMEMKGWTMAFLRDLGELRLGKMLDKQKNKGIDVPYLKNIHVRWFNFDLKDVALMQASMAEIKIFSVRRGDLFICEGGEPGRCAVWNFDHSNYIYQKALHRFRPNEQTKSFYVAYYLLYLNINGFIFNYLTGTTIKHLTAKSLAGMEIALPSRHEQTEIVRILDDFFEKEKKVKGLCSVLENIDLIKKAILARVFRGQLGTNDPAEASSMQLLKSYLSQDVDEKLEFRKKASAVVPLPRQVRLQLTTPMERSIYKLLHEQGPCSLQEIVSIGKKDLQIMECVRRMVEKRLIQEMNNGFYGLTVE